MEELSVSVPVGTSNGLFTVPFSPGILLVGYGRFWGGFLLCEQQSTIGQDSMGQAVAMVEAEEKRKTEL